MNQPLPPEAAQLRVAIQAHQAGRLDEAERVYRQLSESGGLQGQARCLLGRLYRETGRFDAGREVLESALDMAPGAAPLHAELGLLELQRGHPAAAVAPLRRWVELQPGHADALYNLGHALESIQDFTEAADAFRRALAAGPAQPADIHASLGFCLTQLGREDEAATEFERALAIHPAHQRALFGRGLLFTSIGDFDAALKDFRAVLRGNPANTEAWQQIVFIKRFSDPADADLEAMRALAGDPQLPAASRERLAYALGKALNDLGEYERAFDHFHEANELKTSRLPPFDAAAHHRHVARVAQIFDESLIRNFTNRPSESRRPILIVGMPRSGTTLVEQILSSHPAVAAGGEQVYFWQTAQTRLAPYPDSILAVDQATQDAVVEGYLALLERLAPGADRVTDKFPANFFHVGLVRLLFPEARVLHVHRHPIDNCLSIYFQDFVAANDYANRFHDIAEYYAGYRRMMQHWHTVLPDFVLDVGYEQVIDDLEGQARRMLAFCGLEWDPACLAFSANDRRVTTMSSWQVRQPIYRSASGRWKRYESRIGELKTLLADWLPED